jgi:hypothetical protein
VVEVSLLSQAVEHPSASKQQRLDDENLKFLQNQNWIPKISMDSCKTLRRTIENNIAFFKKLQLYTHNEKNK